jgi:hypothetical protein
VIKRDVTCGPKEEMTETLVRFVNQHLDFWAGRSLEFLAMTFDIAIKLWRFVQFIRVARNRGFGVVSEHGRGVKEAMKNRSRLSKHPGDATCGSSKFLCDLNASRMVFDPRAGRSNGIRRR